MRSIKIYIQYYDWDLSQTLAPVLGDRGMVILDGRNRFETWVKDAKRFNGYRRRIFPGFKIYKDNREIYSNMSGSGWTEIVKGEVK